MKRLNLIGVILLSIGLNGSALISIVSWLLYGKIYFYDGYAYTGLLWTICFTSTALGIVFICIGNESPIFAKLRNKSSFIISSSKGRFVLLGVAYGILFIIFSLCGLLAYWIILTILFAIGLFCYIYNDYYKSSTFDPKASDTEAKENKKKPYSIIIAICLIICIIITLLCSISGGNNSNGTGTCDVCGGDGVVTSKILGQGSGIQSGFDTYYRCGACHGTGKK